MSDDLDHRLREARAGLHRPDDHRIPRIEKAVLGELPAPQVRRRAPRSRRRWYVLAVALILVAGASAVASGRLGDLFSSEPPPEVSRAFLEVGGVEAPNSPRGTTSTRRPPTTVAARLVVADTPWGRYTYWRGLDATGQVMDLVQDPFDGFGGGSACLAFDPVLPPAGRKTAIVPGLIGLSPTQARARLRAAGFGVRVTAGPHPLPSDVVVATLPHVGVSAFEGATIEIMLAPRRLIQPATPEQTPAPTGDIRLCGSGTAEPNVTPTVLQGAVSEDVATAEIAYADGRRMPGFVSNRSILVVVPPQTCDFGLEPPRTLILSDTDGHEIDRIALGERDFDLGGWEANGPPECDPAPLPAAGVPSLFSVLAGVQEGDDALPASIRFSGDQHLRPGTSRLVGVRRYWRLYAVTAKPFPAAPETVCLVDVRLGRPLHRTDSGGSFVYGPGGSAGSACPRARIFTSSFQVSVLRLDPDGTAVIAGLVSDGFTKVTTGSRQTPVIENAYLLEGVRLGAELTATGPAGTRTVRFGGRTGQLEASDRRVLAR